MQDIAELKAEILATGINIYSFSLWSVDEHGFQCLSEIDEEQLVQDIELARGIYLGAVPEIDNQRISFAIKQDDRFSLICLIGCVVTPTDTHVKKIQAICKDFGKTWSLPSSSVVSKNHKKNRLISQLFSHITTAQDVLSNKQSAKAFAMTLIELTSQRNVIIARLTDDKSTLQEVFYSDEKDTSSFPMKVESAFVDGSVSAFIAKFGKSIRGSSWDLIWGIGVKEGRMFGHHCTDMIGVPIKHNDEIYGVLLHQSYEEGFRFDEQVVTAISLVAGSLGFNIYERKAKAELNAIIQEQTKSLSAKNEELEGTINELVRTRRDLVDSEAKASLAKIVLKIAHYLNTPLGNANLASSIIRESLASAASAIESSNLSDLKTSLKEIEASISVSELSIARSIEIVSAFKKLSVHEDYFQKTEFMVQDFVELVSAHTKRLKNPENLSINIECPDTRTTLYGSLSAITEIIFELVNNSASHGFKDRSQGNISIRVEVNKGQLELRYCDDGLGVPESERNSLFNLFQSGSEFSETLGLGLPIVESIVREILRGRIEVIEPANCKGLCFLISMPIEQ